MKYKKYINILFAAILVFLFTTNVFGALVTISEPTTGTVPVALKPVASKIWDITKYIFQITAVAAVVFVGVKYMFESSEGKADLKKSLTYVVIGTVLVFGTTIVIDVIRNIFADITA